MKAILLLTGGIIAAALMAGCSRTPSGIIPPDRMASLMADIHRGDAVVELDSRSFRDDSTRRALKQSILMKHGVSQAEFDSSLMWYGRNMPLYVEVYDDVVASLEDDIRKARVSKDSRIGFGGSRRILDGDTVDLWTGSKSARISPATASEFITFHLSSDRTWDRGDSYHLSTVTSGSRSASTRTIVVEYLDGSAEYVVDNQGGDGYHVTDIYLNPDKEASRIYGSIHCVPAAGEVVFVDSISLIRTRQQPADTLARRGQTTLKTVR